MPLTLLRNLTEAHLVSWSREKNHMIMSDIRYVRYVDGTTQVTTQAMSRLSQGSGETMKIGNTETQENDFFFFF